MTAPAFIIPSAHPPAIKPARSTEDSRYIAANINPTPGIVAVRYQFLTKKWSSFKGMIAKLLWEKATR